MNASKWIDFLPKDLRGNLLWRVEMRKAARHDRKLQRGLRQACFDDLLFFINGFCWLHEPRGVEKVIPFISWSHQDPVFLTADQAITDAERDQEPIDVVWDKTRAQGASWMFDALSVRRWLRDRMFSCGLVTRNLETCDSATDPGTLMWKVNYTIEMLPFWMRPNRWERLVSKHSITNYDLGSTFQGFTATDDVAAGGRLTVLGFDEVARFDKNLIDAAMDATQHVTLCRQFISAHFGDSGAFYEMVFGENSARKIVLDWKDNPTQNKCAYRYANGVFTAVRAEEAEDVAAYVAKIKAGGTWDKLKRRGFVKEGAVRSPWYDKQCLRPGATPRGIAQELDRDPRGTVGKLFNKDVLDAMREKHVRPPVWEGRPTISNDGKIRLIRQEGGPLKLWFEPGLNDEPPSGKYAIAADIGTGGGVKTHSNSVLEAGNCRTGEQLLEFCDPGISETRFGRLAVAMAKWLGNALLIWEAQGPTGKRFATEVQGGQGYGHVWYRPKDTSAYTHEPSTRAGWVNNRTDAKADLFDDFWIAMDEGTFVPRSGEMLKECDGWEWDGKNEGKIVYSGDTGHGDRAIAGGLLWKAMKDFQKIPIDNQNDDSTLVKYGTLAWRQSQERHTKKSGWCDIEETGEDVSVWDVAGVGASVF